MKLKTDAEFVREETKDHTREQLINEIIRLRKVWRIDVSNLVKERDELRRSLVGQSAESAASNTA